MFKKAIFLLLFCPFIAFSQCPPQEVEVIISITPDDYPTEISWDFKDSNGNLITNGDSLGATFCVLDSNCYNFTIYDSYGDGLCCTFGQGSYFVSYNGQAVASGGQYTSSETTLIGCPVGTSCDNPISVFSGIQNPTNTENWFSFIPDTSGQFNINTCASSCNTIIYLYDYCQGLIYDNTNQGTIYYNDDYCSQQSEIYALLIAGEEYFIRISDGQSDCANSNINWEILYTGPISGCMDPIACNYNPIATISDSCIYFGSIDCPFQPDLMVIEDELENMYIDQITNTDQCMIDEGCIQGYGTRDLIRFTTWIKNIGNLDYFIGSPDSSSTQFEFDPCHNHWHYDGYAEYVLYDQNGQKTPAGFKNGFCVMDLECSGGGTFTYGCNTMGISAGCGDIYSSGLSCQWIDITEIDTGRYTFAIKVNWDQAPDALGNHESDYENNWGQICFNLNRDSNGNPSIVLDSNCPPYTDCAGIPYGNTEYDCNGICGGAAIIGDMDGDTLLTSNDAHQYVFEILNNTVATNCSDLNNDGLLTVSDAAISANCTNFGNSHIHPDGPHDHCHFGYEIINPFDSVSLSIGNLNLDSNYFDVFILNPDNEVVAYEFEISGAQIIGVDNLIGSNYPILPEFVFGGNKVVGISYEDSTIIKNYLPAPLCRIHYMENTASNQICLNNIVDIINQDYEDVITSIIGADSCFAMVNLTAFNSIKDFKLFPNPAREKLYVQYNSNSNSIISLTNSLGHSVLKKYIYTAGNSFVQENFDIKNLPKGIYLININSDKSIINKTLVIE